MAYGFSVFWLPPRGAIGVTAPIVCPDLTLRGRALHDRLRLARQRSRMDLHAVSSFSGRRQRCGAGGLNDRPTQGGCRVPLCWCGGIVIAAGGVIVHQLWIMWLGAGVLGGIGLGLGYISPVSTLIRWFPIGAGWQPEWRSWDLAAAR